MSFRLFILTLMFVIAIINMALNTQKVEFQFLWSSGSSSLSVIHLFSMAYGVVIGVLYIGYVRANQNQKVVLKNQKKN